MNEELERILKEDMTQLKYHPSIFLVELRKARKGLSQDCQCTGQDLNQAPPKYESRMPMLNQLLL
jgi:hypothetical protein